MQLPFWDGLSWGEAWGHQGDSREPAGARRCWHCVARYRLGGGGRSKLKSRATFRCHSQYGELKAGQVKVTYGGK